MNGHSHLLLFSVEVVVLCPDDLSPHSGQGAPNTGLGVLGRIGSEGREETHSAVTLLAQHSSSFTKVKMPLPFLLSFSELSGNPRVFTQPRSNLHLQDPLKNAPPKHKIRRFETNWVMYRHEHTEHVAYSKCRLCTESYFSICKVKQMR